MENMSWHMQVCNVRHCMWWQPSFVLGTLRLEGMAFINVTNWLLAFKPMLTVHTLHCNALDAATLESQDALLQAVGPSVHLLHVHLEYCPMDCTGVLHLLPLCQPLTDFLKIKKMYISLISVHAQISMLYTLWKY